MSRMLFVKLSLASLIVALLLASTVSSASLFQSMNFPSLSDQFTFGNSLSTAEETYAPGTTVTKVEKMGTPFSDLFSDTSGTLFKGMGASPITSLSSSPITSFGSSSLPGWSPFAPAYSTYQSTTSTVTGPDGPQTVKTEISYDPTTREKTTTTTYL